MSMGIAPILWSIGIDWEISGPMNIISMANRLIQVPRAEVGRRRESGREALTGFIQSVSVLVSLGLRGRL